MRNWLYWTNGLIYQEIHIIDIELSFVLISLFITICRYTICLCLIPQTLACVANFSFKNSFKHTYQQPISAFCLARWQRMRLVQMLCWVRDGVFMWLHSLCSYSIVKGVSIHGKGSQHHKPFYGCQRAFNLFFTTILCTLDFN